MESWKSGNEELIEQIIIKCKAIGKNIAAELDNENFTTVARDELRYLRDKSTRVDELTKENNRLTEELREHSEALSRVEELEKENKRLRELLSKPASPKKWTDLGTPQPSLSSEPPSSVTKFTGEEASAPTVEQYNALTTKYHDMKANYGELRAARNTIDSKYREERKKNENWTAHDRIQQETLSKRQEKIQRQAEEIQKLRAKLAGIEETPNTAPPSIPSSRSGSAQVQASPGKGLSTEAIINPCGPEGASTTDKPGTKPPEQDADGTESLELPNLLGEGKFSADDTHVEAFEIGNSSSTEDAPESPGKPTAEVVPLKQQVAVDHPPLDDIPVILSARSIKKRKAGQEIVGLTPVKKVKVERINSSPLGAVALQTGDSFDLDEIGNKTDTPKKARRIIVLPRLNSNLSLGTDTQRSYENHSNRPTSLPIEESQDTPTRRIGIPRASLALQPLSTNRKILPRTSNDKPPTKRRVASDQAVEDLGEDGGNITSQTKTPKRNTGGNTGGRLISLLSKPSPPKPTLSPMQQSRTIIPKVTSSPKVINEPNRSKVQAKSGLAREVATISDHESDGAASARSKQSRGSLEPPYRSSKNVVRAPGETSRPSSKGSMRGSAEPARPSPGPRGNQIEQLSRPDRPPKTPVTISRPASRDSAGPPKTTSIKDLPRKSIESSTSPAKRTPRHRTDAMQPHWNENPDNQPLRTRPLSMLSLDDFKVNPSYNRGFDYAYTEVTRKKEDKKCLKGCTKPECCGPKHRAMAEALMDNGRPPTLSQEEIREKLLKDYMGDNYYRLDSMTEDERFEMLLKAKARDLANHSDTHRRAYDRPRSPPGLWDANFPTTQEEALQRAEADEYKRGIVAERYEEAMRPGGQYMFRDE